MVYVVEIIRCVEKQTYKIRDTYTQNYTRLCSLREETVMFLQRRAARRLSSQLSEVRLFLLRVCKRNVDA